jgi:DMSO/TMAO reductase YedYZ heme-binding membrane subunit
MAKRGVGLRGRTIVAVVLASFLAVTMSVIWRRSVGTSEARRLQALSNRLAALDAQHAQLEGQVRQSASLVGLAPAAQRLGMRMPNDSQVIYLPLPPRRER